jgi:hypothetical protein
MILSSYPFDLVKDGIIDLSNFTHGKYTFFSLSNICKLFNVYDIIWLEKKKLTKNMDWLGYVVFGL